MTSSRHGLIDETCSCRGNSLDRFIQPNLLYLLSFNEKYGYELIQELSNLPMFFNSNIDKTGVYRALDKLEAQKRITSYWDSSVKGPQKKMYCLTESGNACIASWIETLKIHITHLTALTLRLEERIDKDE